MNISKQITHLAELYAWRIPLFNKISAGGAILKISKILLGCKISTRGKGNIIILKNGGGFRNVNIHIDGNNNKIIVGNNASMVNSTIWIEDDNNCVSIGDHTSICGKTEIACIEGTSVCIGEDCLFSSNITMRTGDSHSILNLSGHRINESKNIIIDDHVWVGNSVIILKGVHICRDSIIGAGSVVTHQFADKNIIIAGNPAKVVREDISWDRYRI